MAQSRDQGKSTSTSRPLRTAQPRRTSSSRAGTASAARGQRTLRTSRTRASAPHKASTSSRTRRPGSRPASTVKKHKGFKPPTRIPLAPSPRRLRLMLVAVAIALSLCGGRLLQLQGFDSAAYANASTDALTRNLTLLAARGSITDRNGVVLAATEPAVAVTADPRLTSKRADAFAAIASKYLGMTPAQLLPLLIKVGQNGQPASFVYLKKKVPAITYTKLAQELSAADLYGVFRENDPIRTYPGGSVAGNLIGLVNVDGVGQMGLERQFNAQLAGTPGKESYESAPDGHRIPLGTGAVTPAENGLNYQSTLDSELQFFAQKRIAAAVSKTRADWGFAITMDVKTGEVLAMAQSPSVDLQKPGKTVDDSWGVRPVSTIYEPGSVEKVLTSAALLDSGTATPDRELIVPKLLKSGPTTIKDFIGHETDHLLMRGVVAESSNIGMALLARQMPKAQLAAYLKKFGLGAPTGIELPNEGKGILPDGTMQDLTRDRVAFGQALAVTGIQEISAVAGIINGGVYHPPTLIKAATQADGTPVPLPTKGTRQIISAKASAGVRDMMGSVIDHGAPTIKLADWTSGGKTGTAQRADSKCGCYNGYTTSFIGFAPRNDPRIITYVVLDHPKKGDTGSATAGPVYQDLMEVALPRYGVPPATKQPEVKPIFWGPLANKQ